MPTVDGILKDRTYTNVDKILTHIYALRLSNQDIVLNRAGDLFAQWSEHFPSADNYTTTQKKIQFYKQALQELAQGGGKKCVERAIKERVAENQDTRDVKLKNNINGTTLYY